MKVLQEREKKMDKCGALKKCLSVQKYVRRCMIQRPRPSRPPTPRPRPSRPLTPKPRPSRPDDEEFEDEDDMPAPGHIKWKALFIKYVKARKRCFKRTVKVC